MQRIKSFLGWGFAAFFTLLLIGASASGSTIGAIVLITWILVCLPVVNRYVLRRGVRHWVWWKVAIFVIGLMLIGSMTEPAADVSVTSGQSPPVASSPSSAKQTVAVSPSPTDRLSPLSIKVAKLHLNAT